VLTSQKKNIPFSIKGHPDLKEEEWEKEVFYFPLEPRKPIQGFDDDSGFFVSKKIPLRIVARLSEDKILYQNNDDEGSGGQSPARKASVKRKREYKQVKLMFKYGDDLRQDNLVL
jgi:phosphatidylinositol kinase/protein kinase (PI-3  family)